MKLIVCLDEHGGMLFNHRRQSSDRIIRSDILHTIGNKKLVVNPYTAKLFSDEDMEKIDVTEEPLVRTLSEDYVFIEDRHVKNYEKGISQIVVYRWKRKYPADFFFDIELGIDWILQETVVIKGYSHEEIVKEIYEKR